MHAGLPVAIALLAPAATLPIAAAQPTAAQTTAAAPASAAAASSTYGPAAPVAARKASPKPAEDSCAAPQAAANARDIVICAQRPNGYRLNPDVMEARREIHSGGRPHNPHESFRPHDCGIGPAPCMTPGINLIGAALVAAEMASRLAKGEEIGSMFKTTPSPTEYQLYLEAKHAREAKEAEAAAKAKAKAAEAAKTEAKPPQ
jgi:hypothetical protein